jgi:hypothetical protein
MNASPQFAFRLTTLLFAVFLGLQCTWLLLAELSRPGINRLPTDAAFIAAGASAKQRGAAWWAAAIGGFRGDLWAESAFTYADLLLGAKQDSANGDPTKVLERTRISLDRALDDAPHDSGAWLLLAGLALRYSSFDFNAKEALKMSYYTGPSEQDLMPLRLRIAVNSDAFGDVEVRQFVSRDLRLLLERKHKSEIAAIYDASSASGRRFMEQLLGEIDPSALGTLSLGAPALR